MCVVAVPTVVLMYMCEALIICFFDYAYCNFSYLVQDIAILHETFSPTYRGILQPLLTSIHTYHNDITYIGSGVTAFKELLAWQAY